MPAGLLNPAVAEAPSANDAVPVPASDVTTPAADTTRMTLWSASAT
jgi:hypothetical protein